MTMILLHTRQPNHVENHILSALRLTNVRISYSLHMNYALLASQLIRAVRGERKQSQLAEELGYRSNVISAWERSRDVPKLSSFFELLRLCDHDPQQLLAAFHPTASDFDPDCPASMGGFLETLKGKRGVSEIAAQIRMDRFLLSRVLRGQSELRLHDFLELIESLTLGVVDFISLIVDPTLLPEISTRAGLQRKARDAAARFPWAQAVVLLCQLPEYRTLKAHPKGWFASRLGTTLNEEEQCLKMLVEIGRLTLCGKRYVVSTPPLAINTRLDAKMTRQQSAYWLREAAQRAEDERPIQLTFNVFSVAQRDLAKLRALRDGYFSEMRDLIAKSEPDEAAVVTTFSSFEL